MLSRSNDLKPDVETDDKSLETDNCRRIALVIAGQFQPLRVVRS
jgi:hypothetical protein